MKEKCSPRTHLLVVNRLKLGGKDEDRFTTRRDISREIMKNSLTHKCIHYDHKYPHSKNTRQPLLRLAFLFFTWGDSNVIGKIREFLLALIIAHHILQWLGSPEVQFVIQADGLCAWNPAMLALRCYGLRESRFQRLHHSICNFIVETAVSMQPLGSLLSGCYPQQCVLRLVEEIRDWGRSQYIFSSSKIMSAEELPWKLQEGFYAPQWQLCSRAIVQNTGYSGLSHTCSFPSNC